MDYSYSGVKFKTEMLAKDTPSDPRIEELKYWCKIFDEKGLAPPYEGGSYGNLSFRLRKDKNEFIITASQSGLADSTTNDRFVSVLSVDLKKSIVYAKGLRKPSSGSMLHFAIYQKRKDIQAIFHGHCQIISAKASSLKIPTTTREEPYGTISLVKRVLEIVDKKNFLEMKNHGFISLGRTLDEAGNLVLSALNQC